MGDRYVMEAMRKHGAMFGGEQSGHLIFREYSNTGDGLLAALQILRIMKQYERPLSSLAGLLQLFPQRLINVSVKQKRPIETMPVLLKTIQRIEAAFSGRGRVLLRYSGTEPLCRVMVEGENDSKVNTYAEELADIVAKSLAE